MSPAPSIPVNPAILRWAREESGYTPERVAAPHLNEEPAQAAGRIREATGIGVDTQLSWPNEWRAWAAWRTSVEDPVHPSSCRRSMGSAR